MAFWIELHCDKLGRAVNASGSPRCYAQNGSQPGEMARTASDVPRVIRIMSSEARKNGWKFLNGQWTCPECVKHPSNAALSGPHE